MAQDELGIGRFSFPQDVNVELVNSLEKFVRVVDDNIDYLLRPRVATVTSDYTLVGSDYTVLANTSGSITVTLPDAFANENKIFVVKNIGTGSVTLSSDGVQTIDGATTDGLGTQYDSRIIQSDGSNWHVLAVK